MRVLVIGAGAVGLAVGSCLLAAGAEVRFVAKPGGGRPLRERGLRRSGIFGEVSFDPDAFEVVETLRRTGKPVFLLANKVDNEERREAAVQFYELGLGVPQDPQAAVAWYRKAAAFEGVVEFVPAAEMDAREQRAREFRRLLRSGRSSRPR